MNENKFCPIIGTECIGYKCAWHVPDFGMCAISSIEESLSTITALAEDEGICVVNLDDE